MTDQQLSPPSLITVPPSAPPNQEITFKVNKGSFPLLLQIAIEVIAVPFILLLVILFITVSPILSLFYLLIFISYAVFYILSLRAALRSEIVFKDGSMVIKRLFKSYEISYSQVSDINSSGLGFYFNRYKLIFPVTQSLGVFGSGFIYLILTDSSRIELPLLFDSSREKQVLDELKRRITKFGASDNFNLFYQKTEKNKTVLKYEAIFILLMGMALIALIYSNIAKQVDFADPSYPFQFKYPQNWYLEKLDNYTVRVSTDPGKYSDNSCNKCTDQEKRSYSEFYIQCLNSLSSTDSTLTAKQYIIEQKAITADKEKQNCEKYKQTTGQSQCMPTVPGFTQNYIGEANDLFIQPDISAVEVDFFHYAPDYDYSKSFLSKKEYVLLVNHKLACTVDLINPLDLSSVGNQQVKSQLDEIVTGLSFNK